MISRCVLFSGGWDSVAAALKYHEPVSWNYHLLFFDYGQIYLEKELEVAHKFAAHYGRILKVHKLPLEHDMERRNFYFLMEAKRLGYKTVITGNRNIAPIFDKYKDSNYLSIKAFAHLINLKVWMPVSAWPKSKVVKFVRKYYDGPVYNCLLNNDDYRTCPCANCEELRKILP